MMKKLLFLFLLFPLLSIAQTGPKYENDTLYTSSGFKIYKGQTLYFGTGTGTNGKFRYVNIKNETPYSTLANNSIVVKKLKNFGISVLGNAYIEIMGRITYKDGSKGGIDIHMAFDRAIENSPDLPSELIVPGEFRNVQKINIADEIKKLNDLLKAGLITKEEFETRKKKLLEQ